MEPVNTEVRETDLIEIKAACADLGLTYRRMDYYLRKGYVHCENPAPGSGMGPRLLDRREIEVLRLMCKFIEVGFTPEAAALVARRMIFDNLNMTTLPGGIIITLVEEPDSGNAKDDDLICFAEDQGVQGDRQDQR
jgi:hypothetical protein